MAVQSFSGAHPFRPQCLRAALAEMPSYEGDPDYLDESLVMFVEMIDAGKCPRCAGPRSRFDGDLGAGSRVTSCRCVPICGPCSHGDFPPNRDDFDLDGWPLDPDDIEAEREAWAECVAASTVGTLVGDALVTDDGVALVDVTPTTGGWAQHGFDDSEDQDERQR